MKKTTDYFVHSSSPSASDDFHRRKLLLQEEGSDNNDETPQPPPQLQRKHFCEICNKQFSSGKAYGGHVRIHSIEYNNKGKMKKKKISKIDLVKKEKEKEKEKEIYPIRCNICEKEFLSMPSLFGHMSRHPDRSWKGIRPPSPPQNFNLMTHLSSDDDDDDEEDVYYNDYDDDDDDFDDDDDDDDDVKSNVTEDVRRAARILMMISRASSNYWEGMMKAMEPPESEEVRIRSSCDKEDDVKDLIEDMKIKMEIHDQVQLNVNKSGIEEAKRSSCLRFDLNQPYTDHEDHPS